MKRTKQDLSLSNQIEIKHQKEPPQKKQYDGNFESFISTGSTLLDLAISGGRIKGGGIPGGILVEIFGPSGSGKTVLLCEIAGAVQRSGGGIMFHDPEARLNKQFAQMFDLRTEEMEYSTPDTIPEVFSTVREWEIKTTKKINGIFTDSLAALSTELEMENKDGDKMGMRRAKEFSEGLRKTCRILTEKNLLMVCSNQVRVNMDAGPYGQKYISPGGESIGFYSSLRLRSAKPEKIQQEITVAGKKVKKPIGIHVTYEVYKSSIWKPYRSAPITILFDYGIDDVRENLQYIKDYTKSSTYSLGGEKLAVSMEDSIRLIEEGKAEKELKNEVIELWESIEDRFKSDRKKKIR